ncbi:MAG TPA: hypothetical protein VHW03_09790 [Chthoniobacterales bacterium]|nr:hypothetical protein [Chthoniobacterales bacterium]
MKSQDPTNTYELHDIVPTDLMDAVRKARIVITNYHAFMLREKEQISKLNRKILGGREGEKRFTETEGEMIARVAPELMGRKKIIVLNDEAHHCNRHKVGGEDEEILTGEEREEAKKNEEAARVWISGFEAFERRVGMTRPVASSSQTSRWWSMKISKPRVSRTPRKAKR